jgi:hypothetical protein
VLYRVLFRDKIYQIYIADSEEDVGYYSALSLNYNPETYVCCCFEEGRSDKSKRCEICFAFDIEKKTFVELFEISHYNKNGVTRECCDIDHIEKLLSGKVIL